MAYNTVSKKLMGAWVFFAVWLLAAGVVATTLSIVWREPNVLLNLVFTTGDLNAGTFMGVCLLVTFAFAVGAAVQQNHVIMPLIIVNGMLVFDALVVLIIGTFVWFFTLKEEDNFRKRFLEQPQSRQIDIQNHFQCCGYFNTSDVVVQGGFCSSTQFAQELNVPCVGPITGFADVTLNDVFTVIYGFMAIILCMLLATMCVINKRKEGERFKAIDAKLGSKGFV